MKKRLLCIVSALSAGGAETLLMKMFREIDRSSYMLDFVVSENTNGIYEDEVRKLGGKIYEIPLRSRKPISAFIALINIVKKHKYQYVLKMSDTPKGIVDVIAVKIGGAKRVSVRSCNSSVGESFMMKILYNIIRPFFVKITDKMIAPSEIAAKYTFGYPQLSNVNILHNAINLDFYQKNDLKSMKIKKDLGIKCGPIFGHVGRFTPQKNHSFLLKVFRAIKRRIPSAVLILVGEGPLKEDIRNEAVGLAINDAVFFYGVTKDIVGVMSTFDAIIFPSLYEGLPNTIVEAQCMGIPCLISDSITDEIAITKLVKRLGLNDSVEQWAEEAIDLLDSQCQSEKETLSQKGYDIKKEILRFIEITME